MDTTITKFILILLLPFTLTGCGDSPFLSDDKAPANQPSPNTKVTAALKGQDEQLHLFWLMGPRIGEESKILVTVTDLTGSPKNVDYSLEVKIDMPDMSHPSWPVKTRSVGTGVFEAYEVFFTMEGRWDIHFQLVDPDGNITGKYKWSHDL